MTDVRNSPSGKVLSGMTILDSHGRRVPLSVDSFQRLRVSQPQTLFDSKQIYDEQPLYWTKTANYSGNTITYNNARASSLLSVVSGGRLIRQTKRYFNYQPGKSQLVDITYVATDGGQAEVAKRVGLFDDNDGIFIEYSGSDIYICKRSSVSGTPVTTRVARKDWLDKFDGSGSSGVTLDPNAAQVLGITFEWLGVGDVAVGFVIGNVYCPAYIFTHANVITSVYMQTPNLPARYEIQSTGGVGSLEAICTTVISEGGQDMVSTRRGIDRSTGITIAAGATSQILAVRSKGGVYLHTPIIARTLSVHTSATGQGIWRILRNPTVTGAFTPIAITNSACEYDVSRTTVTALGTQLACGSFASATSSASEGLDELNALGVALDGTRDELVLAVTNTSGVTSDVYFGTLNWAELN